MDKFAPWRQWSWYCWARSVLQQFNFPFFFFLVRSYHGNSQGELCYHQTDQPAKIIFISTSSFLCLTQPEDWVSSWVSRYSLSVRQIFQECERSWNKGRKKGQSVDCYSQKTSECPFGPSSARTDRNEHSGKVVTVTEREYGKEVSTEHIFRWMASLFKFFTNE